MNRGSIPRGAATIALLAAALAFVLAACGGAPNVGHLTIVNGSQSSASVHWQGQGFLGKSGTEPVQRCKTYERGFEPGDTQVTVTTPAATSTFTIRAPVGTKTTLVLRIEQDGTIIESGPTLPSAAACP